MTANTITDIDQIVFQKHIGGKIKTTSNYKIQSDTLLQQVYTPGVAKVCRAIEQEPELVHRYTNLGNTVAIVTNGSAILGLGDIGVHAGLPVMEGKAALFSEFAELSGVPILIDSHNVDVIVETVCAIAPSFAAIQLEDIKAPECFEIERRLRERLAIPVLHDDQHGTAVVTLAALINAAKHTNIDLTNATIGQVGLGAAGIGIGSLLKQYGVGNLIGCDLNTEAVKRFEALGGRATTLPAVMAEADVVIATTGVEGLIKPEWVRNGQIILALTNPAPEIEPELAMHSGAQFAADGKSVNNVLGFPGLFKGVLNSGRKAFCTADLLSAAKALADLAPEGKLVPSSVDKSVHQQVTNAVEKHLNL